MTPLPKASEIPKRPSPWLRLPARAWEALAAALRPRPPAPESHADLEDGPTPRKRAR